MLSARSSRAAVCAALSFLSLSPAQAGQVELVSRRDPGSVAPEQVGNETAVSLSADGRWVAFASSARNLVPGQSDANRGDDVFLLDRLSGTITLVSHNMGSPTTTGTGASDSPSISADGRYLVFQSGAGNLTANQTETALGRQVYLYDRDAGTITLVSHKAGSPATPSFGSAFQAVISEDGGTVAFSSGATDLVAGVTDSNGGGDVFAWDRDTGAISLVSHTAASTTGAGSHVSNAPRVSADGRWVLFDSLASDLVSGQTEGANLTTDVFLHDRMAGTTVLVSHAAGSAVTAADSTNASAGFSEDGAYAVFSSWASNLVAGQVDTASTPDVFLYERATGTVTLVSHADGAAATAVGGSSPALSDDGGWVAFESAGTNLVPGQMDMNNTRDVFLWQRATGAMTLASHAASDASAAGNAGTSGLFLPLVLSGDGRFLLFLSPATDLVAGETDTNLVNDAFLYDRVTGTTALVTHVQGSATGATATASGYPQAATISDDGAWAAYVSDASDLTSSVDPGGFDLFLYERASGANLSFTYGEPLTRLTPSSFSTFGVTGASRDGRYVALYSEGTDLVPGQVDTVATTDVFLVDRLMGTTALASHAAGAPATAADRSSGFPAVSDDGAWVVFESNATNLIPDIGSTVLGYNIFLYGRDSGTLSLVSRRASDPTKAGNVMSIRPVMSGDGRYIAFFSMASNLVTGQVDVPNTGDVFVYDRVTGSMALASHAAADPLQAGNGHSAMNQGIGISRDGRWVLFASEATDLVAGQTDANAGNDLFLYDRVTGAVTLVTRSASSPTTTANTPTPLLSLPTISPDGRYVAFLSTATDLVGSQSDANGQDDLLLFDRLAGTATLVSRQAGLPTTTANGRTLTPWLSEDGLFLLFSSLATNLVPGQVDLNQKIDPFLYDLSSGSLSLLSPDGISTHPTASTTPYGAGPGARTVLLASGALDMVPGQVDVNGSAADIFLLDRATGARRLVSRSPASRLTTGNNGSGLPLLRSGGSLVVFASEASDLVAGDLNANTDVFVYTAGAAPASDFYTVAPCRALDTRSASPLSSGAAGLATLHDVCGIPDTAVAVAVNITAIAATGAGNLKVYPGDVEPPSASSINFQAGVTRANNAILPLAYDGSGTLGVLAAVAGGGTVHVAVDVVGYFQ